MSGLTINRLSRRYHLCASQKQWQQRLDNTLEQVMNYHLEPALDALGIAEHEYLCIRFLHLPLVFNNKLSDQQTSLSWSQLLVDRIRHLMAKSDHNVIFYASYFTALSDFAVAVSEEDLQHHWAWNQLDLCNLSDQASSAQTHEQLTQVLMRHPHTILPIWIDLAERQNLLKLLIKLDQSMIEELYQTLMQQMQIDFRTVTLMFTSVEIDPGQISSSKNHLNRVLQSAIYRQLLIDKTAATVLTIRQWCVLINLELEPLLFSRTATVIKTAITTTVQQLLINLSAIPVDQRELSDHLKPTSQDNELLTSPIALTVSGQDEKVAPDIDLTTPIRTQRFDTPGIEHDETTAIKKAQAEDLETTLKAQSALLPEQEAVKLLTADSLLTSVAEHELPIPPAQTEFIGQKVSNTLDQPHHPLYSDNAGLFLLIPVLREISPDHQPDLIKQIVSAPEFNHREFSWVLYQLIVQRFDIELSDLALRIFCGIDIDGDWPGCNDPVNHQEQTRLDDISGLLIARLLQRLNKSDLTFDSVLPYLCQRSAKIIIDHSWVELIFSMDDIDTDIRRAGLDLDPDYVPWLAKVVKFRYE